MPSFIEEHLNAIRALCECHGIRRLDLFGSSIEGRFDEETSDLDLVVDVADRSSGYADRYLAVADGLEALFGRHVDLMMERSIRSSSFRRSVDANRRTICDRRDSASAA